MATTTHGFPYPTNTGLVKDGATNFNQLATAVDDKMGLYFITEQSASGSTTQVSVAGCFSSLYDNYRIVISNFMPSTGGRGLYAGLLSGATPATTADYYYAAVGNYVDGTTTTDYGSALTFLGTGIYNSVSTLELGSGSFDIYRPYKAERTFMLGSSVLYNNQFGQRHVMSEHNLTNSYDGIRFYLSGTGNISKLIVRVYGYRNN